MQRESQPGTLRSAVGSTVVFLLAVFTFHEGLFALAARAQAIARAPEPGVLEVDAPQASESKRDDRADARPAGQRIFTCGHSFHFFVPITLQAFVKDAEIQGHETVGLSAIGGSRVIQHWDVAEESNKAKAALRAGKVDVLTLSPIHLPDEGIQKFAELALKHNPHARITVQENWLPFDLYDTTFTLRPDRVDHNAPSAAELRKLHEPYFETTDAHVRELNEKFGKQAVYVVPVGQAVIALREKIIAGDAPGLATQEDLFTDAIGHAKPALMALVGYCHYAVIYHESPVGLPVPAFAATGQDPEVAKQQNRLLQELAWEAVTQHPLSGVEVSEGP